jgi:CheY-like chemotaxis protein
MKKFSQVLFVDDDATCNTIGERLIKRLQIADNVNSVLNGKEAIQFIYMSRECPELIFLDLNMPLMNGYEFLEYFNQSGIDHLKTNIVILTSSSAGEDIERVQEFGIKYYISKPLLDQNLLKICEVIQADKQHRFFMLGS